MQLAAPTSSEKRLTEHLIASINEVDINAIGEFLLSFRDGFNAEKSIPSFVRIVAKRGIISQAELEIKLDRKVVKRINEELSFLGSTKNQLILHFDSHIDKVSYPTCGNYSVNITKINGSSASLGIDIYGYKL